MLAPAVTYGDAEVEPTIQLGHAVRNCRRTDLHQVVRLGNGRPVDDFILAANLPRSSMPPGLHRHIRRTQGHHRNRDFGHPAVAGAPRRRFPDAVQSLLMFDADPHVAAAFFEDLLFELGAQRVGDEHVAQT